MFGANQPLILHVLEIPQVMKALEGIKMELEDCGYPTLKGVVCTSDEKTAFTDIEYVIFVGAFPRKQGMERKDLIGKNASIFSGQGKALDQYAKKNVKVLVVGNPANTNCLITLKHAPSIPKENFTCLTRLDHNRTKYQLAHKASVGVEDVKNCIIWGNHSSTQFPDARYATIKGQNAVTLLNDNNWLQNEFISTVQQRGAAVINARGFSSAFSAANAIVDHMRDWVHGTPAGEYVSMGVLTDGSYGISDELIFSYPVTCKDGKYHIVQGLEIDDFAKGKIEITRKELAEEKAMAYEIVGIQ
jgi:malate dehydrogenase